MSNEQFAWKLNFRYASLASYLFTPFDKLYIWVIHQLCLIIDYFSKEKCMDKQTKHTYSRRDFLRVSAASGAMVALAACIPPPPPGAANPGGQQAAPAPEQAFLN